MKLTKSSLYLQLAAIVVAMSFGACAYAESPREELAHAYRLLQRADHDYEGHRIEAMRAVEAAGRELGISLKGDLSDHERQWKSDEHMVEARRLLRHAREKLENRDRDRVAERVEKASKEIDSALRDR